LWERITLGFFTVLSIMAWFLTFSRAAWISLVLTMILSYFVTKMRKRATLFFTVLIIIFIVSILYSISRYDFIARFRLQPTLTALELKAINYRTGFDMVKDSLIFGIGLGNYPLLITQYTKDVFLIQNNLHSLYLQILVETGIMGFSAFVFCLVCFIKYLVNSLKFLENFSHPWLFVGLMGGIIVYLFNNLIEVLNVHGIHLQWGIILGLAVVLTQFRESETCPKTVY